MQQNLLAPFPVTKENPEFPVDAVSRNLGRMLVVYGVINAEGKIEKMRIIQSPNPLLNAPLLAALENWSFRPAELNGEPVAVKALLGIPLSLPR
jgi:protein TonB